MGEVYRADDLKLGQPVALKFLPADLDENEERRRRFLNELKVARQVAHPGVCRMYDVAEFEERSFLSMEYVDGEDLAGLLRRIGRLPGDKAVQVARQICAGLGAAHEQGILHRDLKPANIMIDGRGRAKIMDFGLAGLAEEIEGAEIRAGTPAYMAPEQLAGEEVTVQSDLYALGLLLYEIFTGKPAFKTGSPAQLMALQQSGPPATPSSHVEGLDPAVERIILKCLEKDPADRPRSALGVAAALPGGDPLAAALAAGETPSPELLAEAGEKTGLSPTVAWTCLGLFVAAFVALVLMSGRTQVHRVPLKHSGEILEAKAREILASVGHEEEPRDSTYGFTWYPDHVSHVRNNDDSPHRWAALDRGESPVVVFWYVQSPELLVPLHHDQIYWSHDDPPLEGTGRVRIFLEPNGRLHRLELVPTEYDHEDGPAAEPDWSALFEASGLDPSELRPSRPRARLSVHTDARAAWQGIWPGSDELDVRVEAGAFRGKPVYWRVMFPWEIPQPDEARPSPTLPQKLGGVVGSVFLLGALFGGIILARRNLRLGRGDRRGALRTAALLLCTRLLWWLFGAHHLAGEAEVDLFIGNLARGTYYFGLAYVLYLAVEPHVRRLWPERLVSWVRVLNGQFGDPMVGREILLGSLWGVGVSLMYHLYHQLPIWLGITPPSPFALLRLGTQLEALRGDRFVISVMVGALHLALFHALLGTMCFLGLRLVLRREWAALIAFSIIGMFILNPSAGHPAIDMAMGGIWFLAAALMVTRVGFLALATGFFVHRLLIFLPQTFDLSAWYAQGSALTMLILAVLLIYGFRTSLSGRPALGEDTA
jgi:serine/threonine-protein kinase